MKPVKLLLLGSLLFLFACNVPRYVTVPLTYPPKLLLKPDTNVILMVNHVETGAWKGGARKLRALKSGAFSAISFAGEELSNLPHVKVINLVDSVSLGVNRDSIKQLAAKYHADYVLALEKFNAIIGLNSVENSTAFYNSEAEAGFTLYEGNGIYFKRLDGRVNEYQSDAPYPGLIASFFIHPTVGGNKRSIEEAARDATQRALQDYLPLTISHNRPLFDDDALKPAVNEIIAGNFDKAYQLCTLYVDGKDAKLASKAAYNLAVVYEARGNIDEAIKMARFSLDKKQNGFASAILQDLLSE